MHGKLIFSGECGRGKSAPVFTTKTPPKILPGVQGQGKQKILFVFAEKVSFFSRAYAVSHAPGNKKFICFFNMFFWFPVEEGELNEEVVVRDFRTTSPHGAIEGKTHGMSISRAPFELSVGFFHEMIGAGCLPGTFFNH